MSETEVKSGLMTVQQLADASGYTYGYIHLLVKRGQIEAICVDGKKMFDQEALRMIVGLAPNSGSKISETKPYLRLKEAVAISGYSSTWFLSAHKKGEITVFEPFENIRYYLRTEVEKLSKKKMKKGRRLTKVDDTSDRMLSVSSAATYLGISLAKAYQLLTSGVISFQGGPKTGNGKFRVSEAYLRDLIAKSVKKA